jgi:1-acyl-sn-glycerol-3-phosphate acyltransferase
VRNWRRGQFPKVTVQYGDPIRYAVVADCTREQQQAAAEEIFAEVRELYAGLERLGRRGAARQVRERAAAAS